MPDILWRLSLRNPCSDNTEQILFAAVLETTMLRLRSPSPCYIQYGGQAKVSDDTWADVFYIFLIWHFQTLSRGLMGDLLKKFVFFVYYFCKQFKRYFYAIFLTKGAA